MSAYLKRLDIAELDESSAQLGAYIKRVHLVEVVDQYGNPWEPVPPPEIGTVTINPDTASVSTMGSATFSVVVTGGEAEDLTYKWSVRSGAAQLDSSDDEASVTYTFIGGTSAQIQCTVRSATASNSPQSNVSFVLIS